VFELQKSEVLTVNGHINGDMNGDISSESDSDIDGRLTNGYNSDDDDDEDNVHFDRSSITGMSKVSAYILWYPCTFSIQLWCLMLAIQ